MLLHRRSLALLLASWTSVYGQGNLARAQLLDLELLGLGVTYSLNYDTRFTESDKGIGGRIGVSYFQGADVRVFALPLIVNYLAGKEGHYLELGAGGTLVSSSYQSDGCGCVTPEFLILGRYGNQVMGNLSIGYRRQPTGGGLSFRLGLSPVISKDRFVPWWPYVGLGYAF